MRLRVTNGDNGDSWDAEGILEIHVTNEESWDSLDTHENNGDCWDSERLMETNGDSWDS